MCIISDKPLYLPKKDHEHKANFIKCDIEHKAILSIGSLQCLGDIDHKAILNKGNIQHSGDLDHKAILSKDDDHKYNTVIHNENHQNLGDLEQWQSLTLREFLKACTLQHSNDFQ